MSYEDDAIFLLAPGSKIDPNSRYEERVTRVPFLHEPSPPLLDEEVIEELQLNKMTKKPASVAASANPMELVLDDEEDVLPPLRPPSARNPVAPSAEKANGSKMLVDEGDDDDDSDEAEALVESVGEGDDDEEEDEEDDDDDDDEDDDKTAGGQISKFGQSLGMTKKEAQDWAENFVADEMGELDDQSQNMAVLVTELLIRAVSNKKTPFGDTASETSRQLMQELDDLKRKLIESI